MARILVVDDQRNMRTTLAAMLRSAGHEIVEAPDGVSAAEAVRADEFDVVITDLRMGPIDGFGVLKQVKDGHPMTEVIVMTAYGSIESAVSAMRLGAHDYIQKPYTEEELLVKVERALEQRRLSSEVTLLASQFREQYKFENIIGRSGAIRGVISRIVKVAPTDATVLITGESGTGKELVAKAIHANSKRASRPFVPVNCAAISEQLLESELFGHARGAFTGAVSNRKGLFEEADGGTFFFDEIAETPPQFQAKLLRVIQEHEIRRLGENKPISVDARIIAATNQDLEKAISEKRFRQDLYYRLNVARFHLPPLRERIEDIPLLLEHFLDKLAKKSGRRHSLGPGIHEFLQSQEFKGNVRELENMIEQGAALAVDGVIRHADVLPPAATSPHGRKLAEAVAAAERRAIDLALLENEGNREKAAQALGLSTTTLWRKMRRLGMPLG
ncbi:MAG: sigma-54-dependent Fis family transcriptional regulator [Deltaproteobacteria bacterium]|nr:sigma-54-dependent Fis family transcriptional regulator [Deltaproteobacteria bacterium]